MNHFASTQSQCRQLHHEYAGNLARQLMQQQHIHNDQSLVAVLGHGFERDNREVMESWVYAVCTKLKLPFSQHSLPVLDSTLAAVLHALRQSGCHDHQQGVHHGN